MWVKVCANTSLEDALLAAEAGADAVGFVFAESGRRVTVAQVRGIAPYLPANLEKIGVFVDAGFEELTAAIEECGLNGVQLHASCEAGVAARLRERFSREQLRILKVSSFPERSSGGVACGGGGGCDRRGADRLAHGDFAGWDWASL